MLTNAPPGKLIEADAYYLKLLAKTDPKGERASRLVKYLLNNRKHATYWNSTRDTAIARLSAALRSYPILGVTTNIPFLIRILESAAFREGHLGVMDYYNLKNLQSDTDMRHAIAGKVEGNAE